jgi:hypothetical protein
MSGAAPVKSSFKRSSRGGGRPYRLATRKAGPVLNERTACRLEAMED